MKNARCTETMDEVEQYVRERDEALRTLDIAWARKGVSRPADDATLLLALHKTRYESITIPDDLRRESRIWLEERGYQRMGSLPWPKDGSLPK
jgi:hypothetical protein